LKVRSFATTHRDRGALAGLAVCLCLGLTSGLTGCKKKQPEAASTAPKPVPKPAVLIGSVRMEAGRELPSYTPDQMERSVLAHVKGGTFPDVCTPPRVQDRQPVQLTPDGKLSGVMLAASEFSESSEPPPHTVHNLIIRDCRLTPMLVTARIGDSLHIVNETNYPMLPGIGSEPFNETLILGQTRDVKLDLGGVKSVSCGFSSPCGRTDVVVMAHAFHAVTNEKGEFRIENFPADQTVRINAWHPLFFETFVNVRVERGEEKRVELVLTPRPPEEPPKPPPKPAPGEVIPQ
jgi:hypothetical protein